MRQHKNAALTPRQREEIQAAVAAKTSSQRALAVKYGVHLRTIVRWAHRPSGQEKPLGRPAPDPATPSPYAAAIVAYRQEHPTHGPRRIAAELRARFVQAHPYTIWQVLRQHGMSRRTPKKTALHAAAPPPTARADGRAIPTQTAHGEGI
jgi:transposase